MKKETSDINNKYIKWLSELSKSSTPEVGGKGANLAEMYNAKLPVPPAFVITASAYDLFIEETGLKSKIQEAIKKIDVDDTQDLEEKAQKIREMIKAENLPKELQEEIIESYEHLDVDSQAYGNALSILRSSHEGIFVAVRSSATAEDSLDASFAGQQETFVNIKGNDKLIEAVKACIASLFTARAIYYRKKKGFSNEKLAVVVQKMINSQKSGVMFTNDPINHTENIVIESVFGLGEGIVSGTILPDHYLVSRDLKILEEKIADKKIAIVRDSSGKTIKVKLTEERSRQQALTNSEVKRLANYAIQIEQHYGKPQDIEFAVDNEIYIVQTRPITTLQNKKQSRDITGTILLSGIPASPGIASGPVKIVHDLSHLAKIKKGDVFVTEMTNPDMVVAMQKAAAIITDEGGQTSHAAIVSREMGIPCVVGTTSSTKDLKDGMIVTVDGEKGKVYEGKAEAKLEIIKQVIETETEIKVIADLPDFAARAAKTGCKKVGLVRIEGMIAESGKHPLYYKNENKIEKYTELLASGISKIAEHFEEVWIRTSDIRSDEFQNLQGAPIKPELNPMLGMHGIRFSLKYPEIMEAELLAVKKAMEKTGKMLGVMFPQVILVEEVKQAKEMAKKLGVKAKFGVMIETPAAVQVIEDLCKLGIQFISFGTNDLTQFTLAIDRGNELCQYLYDEMNPAILSQLAHVIKICNQYGVESSICGQAGSNKRMAEFLVKQGISSISVNADAAYEISQLVHSLEQAGLRGSESEAHKIVAVNKSHRSLWHDRGGEAFGFLFHEKENKEENLVVEDKPIIKGDEAEKEETIEQLEDEKLDIF
jgi:pyruvate,water dikinase